MNIQVPVITSNAHIDFKFHKTFVLYRGKKLKLSPQQRHFLEALILLEDGLPTAPRAWDSNNFKVQISNIRKALLETDYKIICDRRTQRLFLLEYKRCMQCGK